MGIAVASGNAFKSPDSSSDGQLRIAMGFTGADGDVGAAGLEGVIGFRGFRGTAGAI